MFLLSAKKLFKKNDLVSSMEMKFVDLIKQSNLFITNKLCNQTVQFHTEIDTCKRNKISYSDHGKNGGISNSNNVPCKTPNNCVNSPLDEDLCLSKEDWLYIDSLSVPTKSSDVNSKALFDNKESQSKTLSLNNEENSSCFKTPVNDSVFKVGLHGDIPVFNLGIEVPHVNEMGAGCDRIQGLNSTAIAERPKREKKIPEVQKSPFFDRVTPIFARSFKKEESDLWNWLHANQRHPK